jgi:hypothetical protein
MSVRLFTDKLVCWISEVPRGWSLDSATPSESAYLAHASGSPGIGGFIGGVISGEVTGWACPKICSAIGF